MRTACSCIAICASLRRARARRMKRGRRIGCSVSWMPPSRHRWAAGCSSQHRRSPRRARHSDRPSWSGAADSICVPCCTAWRRSRIFRSRSGRRHGCGSPNAACPRCGPNSPSWTRSWRHGCGRPIASDCSAPTRSSSRPDGRSRPGRRCQRLRIELPQRRCGLALMPPRAALYQRIERRLRDMVESGAIEELRALHRRRLPADLPLMKAVAVPELLAYVAGGVDLETALAAGDRPDSSLCQATDHLAAPPVARAAAGRGIRREHPGAWRLGGCG